MSKSPTPHRNWLPGIVLVSGLAAAITAPALAPAGAHQGSGKQGHARKSTDPPVRPEGHLGQDLFMAIDHRDLATAKELIAKGADLNSRNGLQFVPLFLASASHQPEMMKLLLSSGANPHADSPYGTALTFAAMGGHLEGANILLGKSAKVNAQRSDGSTPLMMAANAGVPPLVATLLEHKAAVNVKATSGMTALALAARNGHVDAGRLLLKAGADLSIKDAEGQTALMHAAKAGHSEFVRLLLQAGAKPDVRDSKGRTALILASSYGDYPEAVGALLEAGADPKAADTAGDTPSTLAGSRGYLDSAKLLGGAKPAPHKGLSQAVVASLRTLQTSMKLFEKRAACVSCHHEGLGRLVTASARGRGLAVDAKLMAGQNAQLGQVSEYMRSTHEAALQSQEAMKQVPLIEMNEVSTGYSWILTGMAAQGQPAKASTAAMAMVLARQQSPEGHWTFSLPRIPMQSSFFTFTALAARALQAYGPKANRAEIAERLEKAKSWLTSAVPKTNEDRSARLLGLRWTGVPLENRRPGAEDLLAQQKADGGWSQGEGLPSDAYATGMALYALRVGGGLAADHPAYRRGVDFLLRTQDRDGTWFVVKRAMPANNYMDSGFPHGESQYSSFNGTSWATLALLESLPAKGR